MSKAYCVMPDALGKKIINLRIDLQSRVGVVMSRRMTIEYISFRCHIPRLVAAEVFNCLYDYHTACSQGNKLCDMCHKLGE